jgi:hypothetical protein
MPGAGLEPARAEARGILSPLRLPIPPPRPTIYPNTCLRDAVTRLSIFAGLTTESKAPRA